MDILIIALNSDELTLATFSSKKGGIRFLSAERHTLEGKENELAQILAGFPPSKEQRKVVLSLPPSMLFMRETEFPITDCAKVRELLPMELKGETALDSDTLIFEALPMMNGKFLAIWAQSKDLLDKINAFKEYGLEPEIVTSTIFHWNRLAPKDKVVAITDGHAIAAYNKGIPIFFRVLPLGSAAEEVSKTISVLECSCNIGIDEIISYTRINSETPSDPVMTPILAEAFGDDNHAARMTWQPYTH